MSASYSLIERLAKHLQRPVPEFVRTRARLHLLDWLACLAGARRSEQATRWGEGVGNSAAWLGNILEMDDVHRQALLHPGPVVWPSAFHVDLYFTPELGRDLNGRLDAVVRGYEAMIAVGATLDAHHYAHWHPTATAGMFGAVAAQFRTDAEAVDARYHDAMADALALAGTMAGGLWQTRHEGDDAKQFHVASLGSRAFDIVSAVEAGVTGPKYILEGPQGLYAAMTREPKPMTFCQGWRIEEVSFKPWAACRHAHPAIDCALELRAAGRLQPPFHLEIYADALTFCDKPDPKTETEAKFSLQHAVAVIADGRDATPADFTLEAIAALAPLRAQVTVAEAPEITARYPAHFGARVNGLELIDCRGDPERPVAEADIVAKMHMLAKWGGLPREEADRAAELALRGDDAGAIVAMLGEWLS